MFIKFSLIANTKIKLLQLKIQQLTQQHQPQNRRAFMQRSANANMREMRVLDYRNCKYQGEVLGERFVKDGFGVLLDRNYLYVAGEWKLNHVSGNCFILFPDHSIFYGTVYNKTPVDTCVFKISQKCTIYSTLSQSDENNLIAVDFTINRTIMLIKVKRNVIKDILEGRDNAEENQMIRVAGEEIRDKISDKEKKIIVQEEVEYQSEKDRFTILEKYFGKSMADDQSQTYYSFIEKNIIGTRPNTSFKAIQSKQQTSLSYSAKSGTVLVKIQNQPSKQQSKHSNYFHVRFIGFMSEEVVSSPTKKTINNNMNNAQGAQISQKLISAKIIEEQVANGDFNEVYSKVEERPRSCMLALEKYYKQSCNFVNQFIAIDYFYRIRHLFEIIEKFAFYQSNNKHAQIILQSNPLHNQLRPHQSNQIKLFNIRPAPNAGDLQNNNNQPNIYQKDIYQKDIYQKVPLEKVKQDIYKAAKKLKPSGSYPALSSQSPMRSLNSQSPIKGLNSPDKKIQENHFSPNRRYKYIDQKQIQRERSSPQSPKRSPTKDNYQQLLRQNKKTFVYLDGQLNKNNNNQKTPQKYNHQTSVKAKAFSPSISPSPSVNKTPENPKYTYTYLNEKERTEPILKIPRKISPLASQNLDQLTQDYFKIASQLRNTPRRGNSITHVDKSIPHQFQKKQSMAGLNEQKNGQYPSREDYRKLGHQQKRYNNKLERAEETLLQNEDGGLGTRKVYKYVPE